MIEIVLGLIALYMIADTKKSEPKQLNLFDNDKSDNKSWSKQTKDLTLDEIYQKHGDQKGVDWRLIKAVALVESGENITAVNQSDPSYGIMQILYRKNDKGEVNKLNVQGWPPGDKNELFNPDYNVHIGSQILSWNISQYGLKKGIAVYNSWEEHSRTDENFKNKTYVDKVLNEYDKLYKTKSD